jgi:uncharacterized lipoprotein YmbA
MKRPIGPSKAGLRDAASPALAAVLTSACRASWWPGLGLLLLSACALTRPVRDTASQHLLDATVPVRATTATQPALAVAKPALPTYLDRPQLVIRGAAGELRVLDEQLWSEPLDAGVARVLATNLARLTGSGAILPASGFVALEYDRLVELRLERCEPGPDGNLVFEATWKLQQVTGPEAPFRSFRTVVPAGAATAAAQVAATNEALARLARAIAAKL